MDTEGEIRALLDRRSKAMREKDIEQLMSCYSPDVVYFDVVPPLQYVGTSALRERFLHWFMGWDGPIGQEISHLSIQASGNVAAASMLIHSAGALNGGHAIDRWLRTSDSFMRSDEGWRIIHEHVSVPVDLASGRVVGDLEP